MESKLKLLKNKLEIDHYQIKSDSILQLYEWIINEKSVPIFDQYLNQLLQSIFNPSIHVVETSISCLIKLVELKKYSRESLINHLLDSVSSVSNDSVSLIIETCFNLSMNLDYMMSKQQTNPSQKNTNNNSDYNPSAPLINLVKKPIVEQYIYTNIDDLLDQLLLDREQPSSIILQRFKFLKHVFVVLLLNNERPLDTCLLHKSLVKIAYMTNDMSLYLEIVSVLSSILFLYTCPIKIVLEYSKDIVNLVCSRGIVMGSSQDVFTKSILSLAYYQAQVFVSDSDNNSNSSTSALQKSCLNNLEMLVSSYPTIMWQQSHTRSQSINAPIVVVLFAVLPSTLSSFQQKIIDLIQKSIDSPNPAISPDTLTTEYLQLFILPLIRMISNSSKYNILSNQTLDSLKSLLKTIENMINDINSSKSTTTTTATIEIDIYLNNQINLINQGWKLYNESIQWSEKEMIKWLDIVHSNLLSTIESSLAEESKELDSNHHCFNNELLIFFLSPYVLFNQQSLVVIKTVELLPDISTESIDSISLVPIYFYLLQRQENSQAILSIMENITKLTKHKLCFGSVVKILGSLSTTNDSISSVLLRVYAKLYRSNDKILPKIQEMIYAIVANSAQNPESHLEERVAAAATIKDICELDPDQGQELIQPLSQFLCKDTHPTTLSLSLDALTSLCKNEVLSFTSAWNVIKKNLGAEEGFDSTKRSPMVLEHLLDFFLQGTIDCQAKSQLDEKTIDVVSDIFKRIFNLTKHTNPSVQSKAYYTLSQYLQVLENQELLERIQMHANQLLETLGNSDIVDDNLNKLLTNLLELELQQKRSLKTAHMNMKQTKSITLGSQITRVSELLQNDIKSDSRAGIKSGVLGGLLWSYSNSTSGSDQKESKKEILVNYKTSLSLLSECLEYMDNSRDLINKIMSIGGWSRFMNECFISFKKYDLMRQSLPSNRNGPVLSPKELNEKIFDDIKEILLESLNANPSGVQAENSVFALVMLAHTVSSSCYAKFESIVTLLLDWISNHNTLFTGNTDLIRSAAYLGLGILLPCLLEDSLLVQECIDSLRFACVDQHLDENIRSSCYLSLAITSSQLSLKLESRQDKTRVIEINNFIFDQFNEIMSTNETSHQQLLSYIILSIGYCIPSMESLSMTKNMDNIYQMFVKKFINAEKSWIESDAIQFGCMSISFATILSSCFKLSIVNQSVVEDHLKWFKQTLESYTQHKTLSIYLGIAYTSLIQNLLRNGYNNLQIETISTLLSGQYLVKLSQPNESTSVDLISCIFSSGVLLGSPMFSQYPSSIISGKLDSFVLDLVNSTPSIRKDFQSLINDIISSIINLYKDYADSKLIRYAAWVLGSISIPLNQSIGVGSDVPENLDHLPADTYIKSLFKILTTPKQKDNVMESCVAILNGIKDSSQLPIVNWGSIIKKIYNASSPKTKIQCIIFSATNASLSNLSINISEWFSLSTFKSLPIDVQISLIESLSKCIHQLPSTRVVSIFDDIMTNISNKTLVLYHDGSNIKNLQLIWNVFKDCLDPSKLSNLSTQVKEHIFNFIASNIKNLPSPFEGGALCVENINLLNIAKESLRYLPTPLLLSTFNLSNSIINLENDARNIYLYVLVLGCGTFGKISLSHFYKIKSWCFSCTAGDQLNKVLSLVNLIYIQPLSSSTDISFKSIFIDLLDSILLSNSQQQMIGLEILSGLIIDKLDNKLIIKSLFNQLNNASLNTKNYINLAYYLSLLFKLPHKELQLNVNDTKNKLVTILQNKVSTMDIQTKTILFGCILSLSNINVQSPSPSDAASVNNNRNSSVSLYTLYKLIN
ncbi:hypothetical protein CYY_002303 [Polysphondylium violaceum]|uniref:DUF3730 domain-containing protein n=1 Tax=Polysphondylium violaceum TaxID=133409 RepID=A0A8J4PX15_9MYCE|nr:hypothetical protein CYY_002303 [Polysphondylium violaceum]